MAATFLRLYLLLVLAILGFGYGLDRIWQAYAEESPQEQEKRQLIRLVDWHLQALPGSQWSAEIGLLNQQLSAHFSLIPAATFAASAATRRRLAQDEIVLLEDASNVAIAVKQLPHSDWLLMESRPEPPVAAAFEKSLVFFFYALIALVVWLWVWPLSRALTLLEKSAVAFGKGDWSAHAQVKSGSPVAPLANAFNQMAQRISDLIRSHKEFSHAVSHELRTPLARMKFALTMASDSNDEAVLRKNLKSIAQDTNEMDTLINELLSYAAFETKEVALNLQRGDFRSLVEGKIAQTKMLASRPLNVVFDCQVADGMAICDAYFMERALQNLLLNACRYADSEIRIEYAKVGDNFLLAVDDDGPGVPDAERQHIFEAFVRIDDSKNRKGQGFGLGLAIVRRIALWHKGEVFIETSALGGARFVLRWPANLS